MNNTKKFLLLRFTQSFIISFLLACVISMVYFTFAKRGLKLEVNWYWIMNATVISTVAYVSYIYLINSKFAIIPKDDLVGEFAFGILLGAFVVVSDGMDSVSSVVPEVAYWISLFITFMISMCYSKVIRSIVFSIFFLGMCGVFLHISHVESRVEWLNNTSTWFGFIGINILIFAVVIACGKFLRFIFIKKHDFAGKESVQS